MASEKITKQAVGYVNAAATFWTPEKEEKDRRDSLEVAISFKTGIESRSKVHAIGAVVRRWHAAGRVGKPYREDGHPFDAT